MRDTQRSKVYAWQKALHPDGYLYPNPHPMTLAQCDAVMAMLWRRYRPGLIPPTPRPGGNRIRARAGPTWVRLPLWTRTRPQVCHETAHVALYSHRAVIADHGPEFVRLLADMLVSACGGDVDYLIADAGMAGLRVAPRAALECLGIRGLR